MKQGPPIRNRVRDEEIFLRRRAGTPFKILACDYNISMSRASDVYYKECRKRGVVPYVIKDKKPRIRKKHEKRQIEGRDHRVTGA